MKNDRDEARWDIVRAANKHKLTVIRPFPPTLFGMRHIQQAVCTARRFQLVKPELLVRAGFRAVER